MVKRSELDGSAAEQLARWPSHGPAWDAAIAAGCDVALLEANLRLTPAARLEQLDAMTRLWWSLNGEEAEEAEEVAGEGRSEGGSEVDRDKP